jgi:hypothetical protein
MTVIFEGVNEEQKWNYILQPEGIIHTTYNDFTTERTIEFVNNRKIIISEMTIMYEVNDTGEAVFKKKSFSSL